MMTACPSSPVLFASCLFAQGLQTTATKDDWEEINYEFNSSILSDGYPTLLRLAELLQQQQLQISELKNLVTRRSAKRQAVRRKGGRK